eukprot:COSAG01_NODE_1711_length_9416_cov_5.847912_1_plen_98_part_10
MRLNPAEIGELFCGTLLNLRSHSTQAYEMRPAHLQEELNLVSFALEGRQAGRQQAASRLPGQRFPARRHARLPACLLRPACLPACQCAALTGRPTTS